jgi:Flp pilus assembly protein TadG
MSMLFRSNKREAGTALIEFAIVLPVLVILVIGIAELGLFIYDKQIITNASREGARFGIVYSVPRKTVAAIQTVITTYASSYMVTFGAANTPRLNPAPTPCVNSGDNLTVRVTYTYAPLIAPNSIMTWVLPTTLSATTVMKCE